MIYKNILRRDNWILYKNPIAYLYRMKTVKVLATGEIYTGKNAKEIVEKLRINSRVQYATNFEFMLNYARRAVITNNEDIRAISEELFIADLIKYKHIHYEDDSISMN